MIVNLSNKKWQTNEKKAQTCKKNEKKSQTCEKKVTKSDKLAKRRHKLACEKKITN